MSTFTPTFIARCTTTRPRGMFTSRSNHSGFIRVSDRTFHMVLNSCIAASSNANVIRVTPAFNTSSTGITGSTGVPTLCLVGGGNRAHPVISLRNGFCLVRSLSTGFMDTYIGGRTCTRRTNSCIGGTCSPRFGISNI